MQNVVLGRFRSLSIWSFIVLLDVLPITFAGTLCQNTCSASSDGDCDDGGPGAEFSWCALGTDCIDCAPSSQPSPGPPPPGTYVTPLPSPPVLVDPSPPLYPLASPPPPPPLNLTWKALPEGCNATCDEYPVPGYPAYSEGFTTACSVLQVNCSNECRLLASDMDVSHTWLGLWVMLNVIVWPQWFMRLAGDRPSTCGCFFDVLVVALGWFNAVVMAYRLLGHTASALSAELCLWPHPYNDGVLVAESRFWIWMAVATSPAASTILAEAVLKPVALWMAYYGIDAPNGKLLMNVLLLSVAPILLLVISMWIGIIPVIIWGAPFVIVLMVPLGLTTTVNTQLMKCLMKCYNKSCVPERQWPLLVTMSDDDVKAPQFRKTVLFRWALLGALGPVWALTCAPMVAFALVTSPAGVTPLFARKLGLMNELQRAFLGNAAVQFYGTFTIPQFVWLELTADFETINGQLAIATGLNLLLFIENLLPCVQSERTQKTDSRLFV